MAWGMSIGIGAAPGREATAQTIARAVDGTVIEVQDDSAVVGAPGLRLVLEDDFYPFYEDCQYELNVFAADGEESTVREVYQKLAAATPWRLVFATAEAVPIETRPALRSTAA